MTRSLKKAVALHYPENACAPVVCAKGSGALAEKMIAIAKENKIPVVEKSETLEILYLEDAGSLIPEETYGVIAEIFAFIMKTSEKNVMGRKNG